MAPGLLAAPLFFLVDDSAYTMCDVSRSLEDVVGGLGVRRRNCFRRTRPAPPIRAGVAAMTRLDQAYVLTGARAALKGRRAGGG